MHALTSLGLFHQNMSSGCILCLFLPRIYLSVRGQLYSTISVQQLSSLGNEMWWAGICGTSLFFFPGHPPCFHAALALWRQCTLLLRLPPTVRGTLRHWQDSIYYKYSTHCLNHPLFLQEQEPAPVPGLRKPWPAPPLHSTAAHWNKLGPPQRN